MATTAAGASLPPQLQLPLLLLLLFPTLALLYAWISVIFLWIWGEATFLQLSVAAVPHTVAWIAIAAAGVFAAGSVATTTTTGASKLEPSNFEIVVVAAALAVVAWLSLQLVRKTRVEAIEGGPPPAALLGLLLSGRSHAKSRAKQQRQRRRVIVITGSNTGIGKETAKQLLAVNDGASGSGDVVVVLACRSLSKAELAKQILLRQVNDERQQRQPSLPKLTSDCIDLLELDLSDLASVRRAAAALIRKYGDADQYGIQVLVNNAGLMMKDLQRTVDGYELVMQANHLGHYLFTRLLLPHLSSNACIVNVTSCTYVLASSSFPSACTAAEGSGGGGTIWDDWILCKNSTGTNMPYSLFGQYAASKLANILFTTELAARYPSIRCHAVHPGLVRTDVVRNMPFYLKIPNQLFGFFIATLQKTPEQGAWNTVHVVQRCLNQDKSGSIERNTENGLYWVNRQPQTLRPVACNSQLAEALWTRSAQLVRLDDEDDGGNSNGRKKEQ